VTRTLLTGNGAAAWGARLADVDYVPAFPITPQTEIIESLGAWFEAGDVRVHVGPEEPFVPARKAHPAITMVGLRAFVEAAGYDGFCEAEILSQRWWDEDPDTVLSTLVDRHRCVV